MPERHYFVARFEQELEITSQERDALYALPIRIILIAENQDIVRAGDRPTKCILVLSGLAHTSKTSVDGKRQTTAFHIAGDLPDLQSLHLEWLDSDIRTISKCSVGFINHSDINQLCVDFPRIAKTLWRTSLVDASVFREWVVNVGQRSALARIAHLFCEVLVRFTAVNLAEGKKCNIGLTQVELGEAAGLSLVHVNRMLQILRNANLATLDDGWLTVSNWPDLVALAGFNAEYLHLRPEALLRLKKSNISL